MKEKENKDANLQIFERLKMKGILKYTVFKNGIPIEEVELENLILEGAKDQMARLVSGDITGRSITKIVFGENGTPPIESDTSIQNPFSKTFSGISYPALGRVQFDWGLTIHEANGMSIREFGLVTADGTLFSRRIREDGNGQPAGPINKEGDISIVGQWILMF